MLETLSPSPRLTKPAFRQIRRDLRKRLFQLEERAFEEKLPSMIVFEGWDSAGKAESIREITRRLDPRGFKVYNTQVPRTLETKMPWLWRFWMRIPRYGQMAIFDRSWYGRVTIERVEQITDIPNWIRAYSEINNFERTLAADGVRFIKIFLHQSENEQLRRFVRKSKKVLTAWEVTAQDWDRHAKYDQYLAAYEDMLENTDTERAPWNVIPAGRSHSRMYSVYKVLIAELEGALGLKATQWPSLAELESKAEQASDSVPQSNGEVRPDA
jgi:polyphosphate kinase 2 (PPK2 family)